MYWPPHFARDSDPSGGDRGKELKQVYLKKAVFFSCPPKTFLNSAPLQT
jgi:hypothetical protein